MEAQVGKQKPTKSCAQVFIALLVVLLAIGIPLLFSRQIATVYSLKKLEKVGEWLRHQLDLYWPAMLSPEETIHTYNKYNTHTAKSHTQSQTQDQLPTKLSATVHWMAPFLSGGGYSSEAISYILALADVIPGLTIEQHGDAISPEFFYGLPLKERSSIVRMYREGHPGASICICHSEPGAWRNPLYETSICPAIECRYNIGRTMFETDRIPAGWVPRLNRMNEIWVPTQFHIETFAKCGVEREKLFAVPQAVDVDFFNPDSQLSPLTLRSKSTEKTFKFLSIFKFEKRKAWDVLLDAFLDEFSAKDKVELYILTSAYHCPEGDPTCTPSLILGAFEAKFTQKTYASYYGHLSNQNILLTYIFPSGKEDLPQVILIDRHVPQKDLPRLYKAVDAFVLPTRGEGWGRPTVEAMSMALPVITTNWSGATAFLSDKNGYPLRYDGLELVGEGPFASHMWAKPSKEHLKELMRYVVEHPEEAKERGRAARQTMLDHFTPQRVADVVFQRLLQIQQDIK